MQIRKIFISITVIIAVLAMTGNAFAINRVEVKVTSEPIRYHASCDKGGGFSVQFDGNTTLKHGDQITIDLPFDPSTNSNITLCKDIDIIIAPVATWRYYPTTGAWGTGVAPLAAPSGLGWYNLNIRTFGAPVISSVVGGTIVTGSGVFFHVYGKAGQSRIILDVIGADWLDANADLIPDANSNSGSITVNAGQALTVYFLDQQTNDNFTEQIGIWTDTKTSDSYFDQATIGDNTLCMNVSKWESATINVSMDSKLDKFTFIPSDPQIAHLMAGDISRYICSKETCATILRITQQAVCEFDNDDGTGYCLKNVNRLIIQRAGVFDPGTTYQIEAKIKVNGGYSDGQGVYFSNAGVITKAYQTGTDVCADSNSYQVNPPITYKTALGATATPLASNPNCLIPGASRATYLITTNANLFNASIYRYLYINLPTFFYDSSVMKDGDKVEVEYAVIKYPCGEIIRETVCIGTFNSSCTGVVVAETPALLFPYFTQMNDNPASDNFWDGIVITNTGSAAGTATIKVYEADGDAGTWTTASVPANKMFSDLLYNIYGKMTKIAGTGTLGDSRCYIVVCPNFAARGFAMIANHLTGESMGYAPAIEEHLSCQ